MSVSTQAFALAAVIGLMLAETRLSVRNAAGLRARGAVEPAGDVYGWLSVLYPTAFFVMGAEGIWRTSRFAEVAAAASAPAWWAAGVVMLVASKALKYWAIANLGDRWTFRVLVLPGAPLVGSGPYRYVDHPNYIAVIGELSGMGLLMSAWISGPVAILAFGLALRTRLRVETIALRDPQTLARPK